MEVAGMEAAYDAAIRLVEHRGFRFHAPVAYRSPLVESQLPGCAVDAPFVRQCTAGRSEVLRAGIAGVVLGRSQVPPIRLRFHAARIDRHWLTTDALGAGLGQQLLDQPFRRVVFAFAEVLISNASSA